MIDSRESDAVRLLAHVFLEAGKFEVARNLLLGLVEADPGDNFAQRNLLLARLRLGEYAEALPLAQRLAAAAKGSDKAPALFFLAYAFWGLGRFDECGKAVDRYADCLKIDDPPQQK